MNAISFLNKNSLKTALKELKKIGYKTNRISPQIIAQNNKFIFYKKKEIKEGFCILYWKGNGEEILKVLIKNGINSEWNFKPNSNIKIDLNVKQ